MKVGHVPARKAALVELQGLLNFGGAGTALGDLAKQFIQQTLQPIALIALNVAAKAAIALPQNLRCLGLRKSALAPPLRSFLKSHLAVLLHVAGPAYGACCMAPPQTGQITC